MLKVGVLRIHIVPILHPEKRGCSGGYPRGAEETLDSTQQSPKLPTDFK